MSTSSRAGGGCADGSKAGLNGLPLFSHAAVMLVAEIRLLLFALLALAVLAASQSAVAGSVAGVLRTSPASKSSFNTSDVDCKANHCSRSRPLRGFWTRQ